MTNIPVPAKKDDKYGYTLNINWDAIDKALTRHRRRAKQRRIARRASTNAARNGGSRNG